MAAARMEREPPPPSLQAAVDALLRKDSEKEGVGVERGYDRMRGQRFVRIARPRAPADANVDQMRAQRLAGLRKRNPLREVVEDALSGFLIKRFEGQIAYYTTKEHQSAMRRSQAMPHTKETDRDRSLLVAIGSYVPFAMINTQSGLLQKIKGVAFLEKLFLSGDGTAPRAPKDIDMLCVPHQPHENPADGDIISGHWGMLELLRDTLHSTTDAGELQRAINRDVAPEVKAALEAILASQDADVDVHSVTLTLTDADDMTIKKEAGDDVMDNAVIRYDRRRIWPKGVRGRAGAANVKAAKRAPQWCAQNFAGEFPVWKADNMRRGGGKNVVKRLDQCYPFLTSYNNTIKFDEDIPHPNLPDSYFRFRKDFQLLRLALMVRVEVTLVEGGPRVMSGGNPSARSRRGTTQAGQEGRRGFTVVAYVPAYFLDVSVVCAGDALYQQNAPVVSKEGIKHLATLAARGPVPFDVDRSVVIARPDDAKKVAAHAPLPSLQHVLEDTVIQLAYYDDLATYVSKQSLRPGDALLRNKEFVLAKAAKLRERVLGLAFLQMVMLDHDQHEALMVGLDTGGAFPLEHPHIYFGDFHVLTQPTMTFGEFEVPVTPPPGVPGWARGLDYPTFQLSVWMSALVKLGTTNDLAGALRTRYGVQAGGRAVLTKAKVPRNTGKTDRPPPTARRSGPPPAERPEDAHSRTTATMFMRIADAIAKQQPGERRMSDERLALMAYACCKVFGDRWVAPPRPVREAVMGRLPRSTGTARKSRASTH